MVVVTDGLPDDATGALTAADRAKSTGIEVIAIGTDDANKDFLSKLASRASWAAKVEDVALGKQIACAAKLLPGPTDQG